MLLLFSNNAQSTLAGSISDSAVAANLQSGGGAQFPDPTVGTEYFVGTFTDAATGLLNEIVYVTARVGDTLTIVRGQESTTPLAWAANDLFDNLWTAGQAATMIQEAQAQAQPWNYAVDTGSTNAYSCSLDPALAVHTAGMPIRVKIANPNTSTTPAFNPGPGALTVVSQNGGLVQAGQIDGICEFIYNDDLNKYEVSQISGNAVVRIATQLITATGTYTPTPGMLYADIKAYAGGGGGGGAKNSIGVNPGSGAGGGGAGARVRGIFTAADIGVSKAVTIGAGGTAGSAAGGDGGDGGDTSVGALLVAGGGKKALGVAVTNGSSVGGAGGTPTTGTFKEYGEPGQAGIGAQGVELGGAGGGPGGGSGAILAPGTGHAATGTHGGGGGGGADVDGTTGHAGAVGAPGCVEIIEYIG